MDPTGCPAPAAPATQTAAAPTTAAPPRTQPATTPATATPARAQPSGLPTGVPTGAPAVVPTGGAPAAAGAPTGGAAPTQAAAPATTAAPPTQPAQQAAAPTTPAPATTGAAAPAGAVPAGAAPGAVPQAARGTQPAATPAAAPARSRAITDPTLTAGFWMPAYDGVNEGEMVEYGRSLAMRLDSAVIALVEVFRNTSGAPVVGATGPNILATREKGRWQRCRLIHFDLSTLGDGVAFLAESLTAPTLNRGATGLHDAFEGLNATAECDNIVSMIEAPDRWAPWQQNYESSARLFYRDWYAQLKTLHDAARTFSLALNTALPAARQFPIPPALPPTAPTIGAVR